LSETIDRPETGALVVAGAPVTAVTLFTKGGVETILAKLETEVRSVKRDISSAKGRKEIKSLAFKVARSKTALDDMGKELNESKRAEINRVDADRRIIRERCDALKEEVLSELTAWETKEADRIKGHEDALVAMSDLFALLPPEPTSQQVRESIERLDLHEDNREWQEFAGRAHDLHAEIGFKLTEALSTAVAREEAAAEAERQRLEAEEAARVEAARLQREREARIAAEAAEAARVAAEAHAAQLAAEEKQRVEREKRDEEDARREAEKAAQAEIDALEELNRIAQERARQAEEKAAAAERKAEADRKAAGEKAEADRKAAIEAERARVAAEKAAEEAAAAERARNMEIKRRVNFDAAAALIVHANRELSPDEKMTDAQVKAVIIVIAKRLIPAVEIRY
jgi:hypothetical protein